LPVAGLRPWFSYLQPPVQLRLQRCTTCSVCFLRCSLTKFFLLPPPGWPQAIIILSSTSWVTGITDHCA
jgi:hypothetical protein